MQKWLDDNDILIDSNHIEFKSVITGRFIRTLKGKICNKMTANDSKCYLDYLNNFVDEYNNIYHCSIGEKPIHAGYSALKKLNQVVMILNLKLVVKAHKVTHTKKTGQKKYL